MTTPADAIQRILDDADDIHVEDPMSLIAEGKRYNELVLLSDILAAARAQDRAEIDRHEQVFAAADRAFARNLASGTNGVSDALAVQAAAGAQLRAAGLEKKLAAAENDAIVLGLEIKALREDLIAADAERDAAKAHAAYHARNEDMARQEAARAIADLNVLMPNDALRAVYAEGRRVRGLDQKEGAGDER